MSAPLAPEVAEVQAAIRRLQALFEDLVAGGLRTFGPDRLGEIEALRAEFQRIGSDHLAAHLGALGAAIGDGRREAARALLLAQASLRSFERILTLEAVAAQLELASAADAAGLGAEGDGAGAAFAAADEP